MPSQLRQILHNVSNRGELMFSKIRTIVILSLACFPSYAETTPYKFSCISDRQDAPIYTFRFTKTSIENDAGTPELSFGNAYFALYGGKGTSGNITVYPFGSDTRPRGYSIKFQGSWILDTRVSLTATADLSSASGFLFHDGKGEGISCTALYQ